MDRIRRIKRDNYTTIDNTIVRDDRASMRARGLLLTIMSLPDNWNFTVAGLQTVVKESKNTLYSIIRELIDLGYCVRKDRPKERGKYAGTEYTFFENYIDSASRNDEEPRTKKPYPKKPHTVFSPQLNKQGNNETGYSVPDDLPTHEHPQAYVRVGDEYIGDTGDFFKDLEIVDNSKDTQSQFLIDIDPKPKARVTKDVPIPDSAYHHLYEICYMADTVEKQKTLNSRQRGRVAAVLGHLRNADIDFNRFHDFEEWWKKSWLSKSRDTGQYNPPRPEQVQEYWLVAMATMDKQRSETKPVETQTIGPSVSLEEIERIMKNSRDV